MRPLIVPLSRQASPVRALPAILMPRSGAAEAAAPGNGVALTLSHAALTIGEEATARVTVIDAFGDPVASATIDAVTIIGLGIAVIVGAVPAATNAQGWAEWRVRAQNVGIATMRVTVDGQASNTVPIVVRVADDDISPTAELIRMPYRKLGRH